MKQVSLADGKLLFSRQDGIAHVTFNNPDRLNAMTLAMWAALAEVAEDPDLGNCRALVLSGAGDRAFVSGADISEFGESRNSEAAVKHYNDTVARAETAVEVAPIPTIAKIRGYCIGGGLGIAARCDMRLCTDTARFAVTPAKLGLGYGFRGVEALYRLIGPSMTADLLYTARQMEAPEALRVGLVNRALPDADLDSAAHALATRIAGNAPMTIKTVKASLLACHRDEAARDLAAIEAMVAACYASEDYREGQAAFAEKRVPAFKGR